MQLGLVGLGKMGFNMRERLRAHGLEVEGRDLGGEEEDEPQHPSMSEEAL